MEYCHCGARASMERRRLSRLIRQRLADVSQSARTTARRHTMVILIWALIPVLVATNTALNRQTPVALLFAVFALAASVAAILSRSNLSYRQNMPSGSSLYFGYRVWRPSRSASIVRSAVDSSVSLRRRSRSCSGTTLLDLRDLVLLRAAIVVPDVYHRSAPVIHIGNITGVIVTCDCLGGFAWKPHLPFFSSSLLLQGRLRGRGALPPIRDPYGKNENGGLAPAVFSHRA